MSHESVARSAQAASQDAINSEYSEAVLKAPLGGVYNRVIKRALGLAVALVLLAVLSPLYAIVALLILADSGFPVFYVSLRAGRGGRPFRIIKFRTMVKDADKTGGGITALDDPRITKIGSILRKTKLDELPQLLNIINGTMSFVGPRPELLKYARQYSGADRCILAARPGITDLSSLKYINIEEFVGRYNVDETYENVILKKKNLLRLKYISELSFTTDVKLFFKTAYHVSFRLPVHLFLRANRTLVRGILRARRVRESA